MKERDLRAICSFIKSLGVAKNAVPSYLPPGETPKTPYIQWPMPAK